MTTAEILHVTNGDIAAELLRASGLAGTVLPWRDILHDGPVPGWVSSDELAATRARHIAARGWQAGGTAWRHDHVTGRLVAGPGSPRSSRS